MNKKKAMYICLEDLKNASIGVSKKILMQCDAFESYGFKVEKCAHPMRMDRAERIRRHLPFYRNPVIKEILNECRGMNIQEFAFVYIRYPLSDANLIKLLSYLHGIENGPKVILEFPTYPYESELKKLTLLPRLVQDKIHRRRLAGCVDLITTYSPDQVIYGVPSIEIMNGTDVDKVSAREVSDKTDDTFRIIGVAMIAKHHGFDRIIEGIDEYYRNGGKRRIIFNIVGDGYAKQQLVQLTQRKNLGDSVIFKGLMSGRELQNLYNSSDIAVGSLGMHRVTKLKYVSSLKTREYCCIGIPFLTSKSDYVFLQSKFTYCTFCEGEDSPVDIQKLLEFYDKLSEQYSKEEIISGMRDYAEENLSWKKALRPVLHYLEEN